MDFGRSRRRRRRFGRSSKLFLYSKLSRYALIGAILFIILTAFLFVWYGRDLPQPGKLIEAPLGQSTRIYDRSGILLYSVYQNKNRTYVKLSDIPNTLQNATIAIEDKEFYKNQGFSITGYLRAIRNLVLFRSLSGGSTLTQQLVKNVLLSSERTLPRKIKELILSIQVDKRYTKAQIIELYLNDVPYGGTAIGVEAASETYFGKKVKELSIGESAFLAGLPQSPSVYSPFTGNKYYLPRTKAVLDQMVKQGYITKKQADDGYNEIKDFKFSQKDTSIKAPHFVIYVKQLLADKFGEQAVDNGALQVTTTLDYKIQKEAEQIVKEEVSKLKGYNTTNGSAVVTDPKTGEILAMVGSEDYFSVKNDGNFNVALANRQPGSSLKPVMYAASFEKGYTPSTMIMDVKTDFPTNNPSHPVYTPVNYDGKFRGKVSLRIALANSFNIPAVKTLNKIGIPEMVEQGKKMGIKSWGEGKNYGLSITLGAAETTMIDLSTIYGVLANEGIRVDLNPILKVTDSRGEVLEEKAEIRKNLLLEDNNIIGKRVLDEGVAFILSDILADNNARALEFGTNSPLNIANHRVSVKTGTSDNKRDNWTIGYTPKFVVAAWVGNNDNSPMSPYLASGITGAAPIWNRIMTNLLINTSDNKPTLPPSVVQKQCLGRLEYFIRGTENSVNCAPLPSPSPTP